MPPRGTQIASLRIARLAERQWGVISRQAGDRLRAQSCGAFPAGSSRGRLHRLHPGVYAVGHGAVCIEGRLVAALLYAGRGLALSHTTAAWWWGLTAASPTTDPRQHPAPGRAPYLLSASINRAASTPSATAASLSPPSPAPCSTSPTCCLFAICAAPSPRPTTAACSTPRRRGADRQARPTRQRRPAPRPRLPQPSPRAHLQRPRGAIPRALRVRRHPAAAR